MKGTTAAATQVILTRNEVIHAQKQFPAIALYVLAGITVTVDSAGQPVAQGGQPAIFEPWRVDAGVLVPLGFVYSLPSSSSS